MSQQDDPGLTMPGTSLTAFVSRFPVALATFLILLVLGVTSAVVHGGGLVGDQALLEIQTRSIASWRPPLTGAYSRYGWAHPGPAMLFLMAPIYFVLGATGSSLMIAASTLNASFGASAVALAERSGRNAALGTSALVAVVLAFADEPILAAPWNPRATVIPMALLVVAATLASLGDDTSAGVVVVIIGLIVSAHAGIGAAVVPLAVAGLACWWHRRRRLPPHWSLAVLGLLVLPLAADTVVNWPGNPVRVVRFALTDDSPQLGATAAARFFLRAGSPEFILPDRYDGFAGFVSTTQPLGLVPGALIVVLALLAWKGANSWITAAARLVIVGLFGTAVSIAGIRGVPFEYLLLPLPVLSACGWVLAATHLWIHGSARLPAATRLPRLVLSTFLAGGLAAASITEISQATRDADVWSTVDSAAAAAAGAAEGRPILVVADIGDPFALIQYFGGVLNELDRRGIQVRVLPGTAEIVGAIRDGDPATTTSITLSVLPDDEPPPDRGTILFSAPTPDGSTFRLQLRPNDPTTS